MESRILWCHHRSHRCSDALLSFIRCQLQGLLRSSSDDRLHLIGLSGFYGSSDRFLQVQISMVGQLVEEIALCMHSSLWSLWNALHCSLWNLVQRQVTVRQRSNIDGYGK